jgi:transposase
MPQRLVGDKGYSAEWIRELLDELKIQPVIAHHVNEAGRNRSFDKRSLRKRNIIERCVGWLK